MIFHFYGYKYGKGNTLSKQEILGLISLCMMLRPKTDTPETASGYENNLLIGPERD